MAVSPGSVGRCPPALPGGAHFDTTTNHEEHPKGWTPNRRGPVWCPPFRVFLRQQATVAVSRCTNYLVRRSAVKIFSSLFASTLFWAALAARGSDANSIMLTAETGEDLSGGDTTVFDTSPKAFGFPAHNLREEHRASFFVGHSFFNENWVVAPASTAGRDGLGPLFNT